MTEAVLAYDIGRGAGFGHRARMEALLPAIRDHSSLESRLATTAEPVRSDLIVVDSYRHRADDPDRFGADNVVAVEDLGRDLAVDLLIDPNPEPDKSAYRRARHTILGPRYALVQVGADIEPKPVTDEVESILVSTGAGQGAVRVAAEIAGGIAEALPGRLVQLVRGPWADTPVPHGIETLEAPRGLAAHLARADIVVTAAGVTLLEALLLGRPTVVLAIAENQRRAAAGVRRAGVAVVAPDKATVVVRTAELAEDSALRGTLGRAAAGYIDGGGPRRVAEAICAL